MDSIDTGAPALPTVEQRLDILEDIVRFIGSSFRIRQTLATGLTAPDGRPIPGPTIEGTMLDLYLRQAAMKQARPAGNGGDGDPTPLITT